MTTRSHPPLTGPLKDATLVKAAPPPTPEEQLGDEYAVNVRTLEAERSALKGLNDQISILRSEATSGENRISAIVKRQDEIHKQLSAVRR